MTSKVTSTKVVMYLTDSEDSALKSMAISLCDSWRCDETVGKEEEVGLYLNARESHVGPYKV